MLILRFIAAAVLFLQAPAPPSGSVPVIPPAIEIEYLRADDLVLRIKPEWDQANSDLQAATRALMAACGEGYSVAPPTRENRHFTCVAKK